MFSLLSVFIVSEKVTQENLFSLRNEKWNGKRFNYSGWNGYKSSNWYSRLISLICNLTNSSHTTSTTSLFWQKQNKNKRTWKSECRELQEDLEPEELCRPVPTGRTSRRWTWFPECAEDGSKMGVMRRVVKPKTGRSKRALEAREPKAVENTKTALVIRGRKTSEQVRTSHLNSCF